MNPEPKDELDDIFRQIANKVTAAPRPRVVVNVSAEVYAEIMAKAVPIINTPDSVLRRLLGLPPRERKPRTKKEK